MPKINPQEVASQVLNRKVDRVDIQMLVALEAAPRNTLRLEDRMETVRIPPPANAPKGTPPRAETKINQGLQSQVDAWCDARPDLTVVPQEPLIEKNVKTGEERSYERDPIVNRFTVARLERMTSGSSECPALIEHVGGADEETAKQPTRLLQLSPTGEVMLALWRDGRLANVPFPDAEVKAEEPARQESQPPAGRPHSAQKVHPPGSRATATTAGSPTP